MKFEPIYKEKIWGGQNLKKYLNKDIDPSRKVGESWDISDHFEDISIVSNGELSGKSLRWLLENHGTELVGNHRYKKFPLLYKFIDANDDLSVQVHPDDEYVKGYKPEELGKTEAWYVVHAEPGAKLMLGLKEGTLKEDFEKSIKSNTLEKYLHEVEVQKGDVIFIPPGRLHAIMKGIVVNEIQENSDMTFRVYDWGRMGFNGKPRPLHIKESMDVINFRDYSPEVEKKNWIDEGKNKYAKIIDCNYFSIEEYEIKAERTFKCSDNFKGISVIEGSFELNSGDFILDCVKGESALVPAVCESFTVVPEEPVRLLLSYAK